MRACLLAIVAAEEPVAGAADEFRGHAAALLDGDGADAAARVHRPRRDGPGGARIDAPRAAAARVERRVTRSSFDGGRRHRAIGADGREFDRRDHRAQQHPRSDAAGRDQQRVLADPPHPGALGVLALEERRGVDADAEPLAGPGARQFLRQRLEPGTYHHVVVLAARIAGDTSHAGLAPVGPAIGVAVGHAEHAARTRHQDTGVEPSLDLLGQVAHAALLSLGNPRAVRLGMRARARLRDPRHGKPMFVAARQHGPRAFQRIRGTKPVPRVVHRATPSMRASGAGARSGTRSGAPRTAPAAR